MGNLFSFGYDMFVDSVSHRLAGLMFSMVENDAFINHNAYIRCVCKDWNDLVLKFSCDRPQDLMLSELVNHFSDYKCFTVGHVMCICAFVSDVLKLNKDNKSECLRVAQMMACKMVQKNKTVCKLYLDIVESGRLFFK